MLVNREVEPTVRTSFIPRGDYIFKSGDRIILVAKNGSEPELERFFGSFQGVTAP